MADRLSYGDSAPIAAIASSLGESALALLRTSGPGSLELLAMVFSRPRALREAPGNSVIHGWILKPGPEGAEKIDEVMISIYRAPRSYTGEDGADISCHGGAAPARAILRTLRAAGFREALPGEFTFRAFMQGKLDLTRAESVMELVSAKTDRSREHALRRLSGELEQEIQAVKALLVQALAGAELFLDYAEDEAGVEASGGLPDRPLAEEALTRLCALAASYRREQIFREGVLTVIAGRPNAGKSSLFNILLREERSIVTDIPGTTRDWIEAWLSLEGIPLRLADTAGLHASGDPVERLGMERSRELLDAADLVFYLIDGGLGITEEDRAFFRDYPPAQGKKAAVLIPVWNKADLGPPPASWPDLPGMEGPLRGISAKTGAGVPELLGAAAAALEAAFGGGEILQAEGTSPGGGPPGIATGRQRDLVEAARLAVEEALDLADHGRPLDLIAPLLREGVNALGEITGEVSTSEILETLFSRFCVGK